MRRRLLTLMFAAAFGLVVLAAGVSWAGAIGWSPNVSRIYSVGLDGQRTDLSGNPGSLSDERVSVSQDRSKIAFERGGEWWRMNADGSEQRRLLSPQAQESFPDFGQPPAWSPDGTRVAVDVFSTDCLQGGGYQCYFHLYSVLVDLAGNRVSTTGFNPTWSPDGTKIASEDWEVNGHGDGYVSDIVVSNADGSGAERPLQHVRVNYSDRYCPDDPSWSTDGRFIAYAVWDCGDSGDVRVSCAVCFGSRYTDWRYVAPLAGGRAYALWGGQTGAAAPVWSPDGSRLAVKRGGTMLLARGDGTHARPLAKHICCLAWSPNGNRLAFLSGHNLLVARGDGTHARPLVTNAGIPHWSPDGRTLAYASGTGQITVVIANGGPPRSLTHEPPGSHPRILAWSQDGKHIIYTAKVALRRNALGRPAKQHEVLRRVP
jgi:Tol biopolymer transport system component